MSVNPFNIGDIGTVFSVLSSQRFKMSKLGKQKNYLGP